MSLGVPHYRFEHALSSTKRRRRCGVFETDRYGKQADVARKVARWYAQVRPRYAKIHVLEPVWGSNGRPSELAASSKWDTGAGQMDISGGERRSSKGSGGASVAFADVPEVPGKTV